MNDKERKPCPFCGGTSCWNINPDAPNCHCVGEIFPMNVWQNAYCWKQLAEKDAEILELKNTLCNVGEDHDYWKLMAVPRLKEELAAKEAEISALKDKFQKACELHNQAEAHVRELVDECQGEESLYMENEKEWQKVYLAERAAGEKPAEALDFVSRCPTCQCTRPTCPEECNAALAAYKERQGEQSGEGKNV